MKRFLYTLLIVFYATCVNAQSNQRSLFPPLGIEKPKVTPYFATHDIIRKNQTDRGYPKNQDATRFLEKAVKENNVVNAEKLLKAGASGFVTYDMIDKKQFEIIDVMYKDNPRVIRYSQLLHYACAKSDVKMIDFLIEREASLDLNGYAVHYDGKWFNLSYRWDNDKNYVNTPADVALYYQKWDNLNHIINKYNKYPSIYGCGAFLLQCIKTAKPDNKNLELVKGFISGTDSHSQFLKNVDFSITDIFNFGCHFFSGGQYGKYGHAKSSFLINEVVSKIAEYRSSKNGGDKGFIDLLNLIIAKGASVNPQEENGAFWRELKSVGINNVADYVNTTPMYIALTNKNMLDIVKLLYSKGASLKTTANGETVSMLKLAKVLDEYKEYFMLEGIQ